MENTVLCCRNRRGRGFTLVELLVVIGIIAVLIAMLLPALNRVRASSNAVACASNLRQLGLGFHMYTAANRGFLPTVGYVTLGYTIDWPRLVNDYLGRIAGREPGRDYMRCPVMQRGAPYELGDLHTYGVNYGVVFTYDDAGDPKPWWAPGTRRLTRVRRNVFLVGDGVGALIYTPTLWTFQLDLDKDKIKDSGALSWENLYNRWDPRHPGKTGNMLYSDGHVSPLPVKDWVRNTGDVWGAAR